MLFPPSENSPDQICILTAWEEGETGEDWILEEQCIDQSLDWESAQETEIAHFCISAIYHHHG